MLNKGRGPDQYQLLDMLNKGRGPDQYNCKYA